MAATSATNGLPSATGTGSSSSAATKTNDALSNLNVNQFLKLMITQLQNQDPLNPTDNNQILQQLSSMQQISTSGKLSTTLDSVLLGQNIASASSLVGKSVTGLTDAGNTVQGVVSQVTIAGGTPYLQIGQDQIQLRNVSQINGVPTTAATTPATTPAASNTDLAALLSSLLGSSKAATTPSTTPTTPASTPPAAATP